MVLCCEENSLTLIRQKKKKKKRFAQKFRWMFCFSFRCDGKSTHILFALTNIFGSTAAGCSDSGKAFTYAP